MPPDTCFDHRSGSLAGRSPACNSADDQRVLLDAARQQYLDLIHRYLQGRARHSRLWSRWAADRAGTWRAAWALSRDFRHCEQAAECEPARGDAADERARPTAPVPSPRRSDPADRDPPGEDRLRPDAGPCLRMCVPPSCDPRDARRFPRLMDALCALRPSRARPDAYREAIARHLYAYTTPGSGAPEAERIDFRPRIPVFERPLPEEPGLRYPCAIADIREALALVPEYDLEGLWAIGLAPPPPDRRNAYGIYCRFMPPMAEPVIVLHAYRSPRKFTLRRSDPGYYKRRFLPELQFGMRILRRHGAAICAWSDEALRQFIARHVLIHEIGHHVQYQERWRSGAESRCLPRRQREKFAEDYAIRFNRELSRAGD